MDRAEVDGLRELGGRWATSLGVLNRGADDVVRQTVPQTEGRDVAHMLIEFADAFDFTDSDFAGWSREVGFREVEIVPLTGPSSAGIAYK